MSPVGDIAVVTLIKTETTLNHGLMSWKIWGEIPMTWETIRWVCLNMEVSTGNMMIKPWMARGSPL